MHTYTNFLLPKPYIRVLKLASKSYHLFHIRTESLCMYICLCVYIHLNSVFVYIDEFVHICVWHLCICTCAYICDSFYPSINVWIHQKVRCLETGVRNVVETLGRKCVSNACICCLEDDLEWWKRLEGNVSQTLWKLCLKRLKEIWLNRLKRNLSETLEKKYVWTAQKRKCLNRSCVNAPLKP